MCTVLLAWRVTPGAPIILGANRDELLARPSLGPHVLAGRPRIAGGSDAVAGGTWLAVAAAGQIAAVTNRHEHGGEIHRDPSRRSRGEIPLIVLAGGDAHARRVLETLDASSYNPVNVLYLSPGAAFVAHARGDGDTEVIDLEPGLHALTVEDVDATATERDRALADALARLPREAPAGEVLAAFESLLRRHGRTADDASGAVCLHGDLYGTVSSSTVVVEDGGRVAYRHAAGRPCVTPYQDVSALLAG